MTTEKLRIIVTGLVARMPVGGMAWHYLQYVIGLARMGHDVYYHEDTWCWPFDPVRNADVEDGEYSASSLAAFFERYAPDLSNRWHYLHLHDRSFGMSRPAFDEVARSADVFMNVSGASFIPDNLASGCVKVFIDTDPGYNQIMLSERFAWSEFVDRWADIIASHDRYFTFAECIGREDCLVPDLGWEWTPTRMPIVTDLWKLDPPRPTDPWTTIMSWKVFKGDLTYEGRTYHDKRREFEKILTAPQTQPGMFRLAIGGQDAPRAEIAARGWEVVSAPEVSLTPWRYQDFIRNSAGEISVAKNVYVDMKTGWFSERSACYLAAGRPVVLQDTGFGSVLPTGAGLLSFDDADGAIAALSKVRADYEAESATALDIAHEYFGSEKVLDRLLRDL